MGNSVYTFISAIVLTRLHILICSLVIFIFPYENIKAQSDTTILISRLQIINKNPGSFPYDVTKKEILRMSDTFIKTKNYKRYYECILALFRIAKNHLKYYDVNEKVFRLVYEIPTNQKYYSGKGHYVAGYISAQTGNIYLALSEYQTSLRHFTELNNQNELKNLHVNIGNIYTRLRDYKNAEYHLKHAASLGSPDVFGNLGLVYLYSGKYELARTYLQNGLKENSDNSGLFEERMSKTFAFEKRFPEAEKFALQSLSLAQVSKDPENQYFAFANLCFVYHEIGKNMEALRSFDKAMEFSDQIQDRREIFKLYLIKAKIYFKEKSYEKAIDLLNEIEKMTSQKINSGTKIPQYKIDIYMPDMYLSDVLSLKAKCFSELFKNAKNIRFLHDADKVFASYSSFITKAKLFYQDNQTKYDLNQYIKPVYNDFLENKILLYNQTKDKKYIADAFMLCQEYNAFVLREQVTERMTLYEAIPDEKLKKKFLTLKNNFLNSAFLLQENYSDSLFRIHLKQKEIFDNYSDSLKATFPLLKKISKTVAPVRINDVQKELNHQEGFLHFFTGEKKIYLFYISKKEFFLRSFNYDTSFVKNVQTVYEVLSSYVEIKDKNLAEKQFAVASHDLYQTIFKDINPLLKKDITSLTIVPDGILFKLPFESLLYKKSDNWDNIQDFLISKYKINYLFYCSQIKQNKRSLPVREFMGWGLEYDDYTLQEMKKLVKDTTENWFNTNFRSESMTKLHFADDEAKEIAGLFEGKTFINELATKKSFLQNAPEADVIHISAHAFSDHNSIQNNAIIFNKDKSNPDHQLTYMDILSLPLKSKFVSLSTCHSTMGKLIEGEGISSLSRAFFEAGSQSVLGSYWSIADQISYEFMKNYYALLLNDVSTHNALREAKLQLMDPKNNSINSGYKIPPFWSAFVIYGNDENFEIINPNHIDYGHLVLLIFILALVLFLALKFLRFPLLNMPSGQN
jgi:CHAT domain-containing protein/lipopolysaccharide biosynthesis regulator YciM